MSTLEVACGKCDKRFRVRAEFAGKSTRCPGCSAAITIGGARPAPPPREDREEKPRPRPRPRDDDGRPAIVAGDWKPVATALAREQTAVIFALVTVLGSFLSFCLMRMAEGMHGPDEALMVLALLFLVGPALVAGAFGVTARVAAVGAPAEAVGRGAATSSLLCAIAGLVSLLATGLASIGSVSYRSGLGPAVALTGVLVAVLGALATFGGFVAQVGIARRSDRVGQAIGRTAVTAGVAVLAVVGIGLLVMLLLEAMAGPYDRHGEEIVAMVVFGIVIPSGFAAVLVAYHRLLAAAREAIRGEGA